MFIKRGKKASLSLSMNAIVIIILAVTMLGLGLTFMRTFMGKGTESLSKVFEGSELEKQAGPLEPLTIDENIKLKANDQVVIPIGFYCDAVSDCFTTSYGFKPDFDGVCSGKETDGSTYTWTVGADGDLELIAPETDVPARKDVGFKAILRSNTAKTGTAICTIAVRSTGGTNPALNAERAKQVIIQVT